MESGDDDDLDLWRPPWETNEEPDPAHPRKAPPEPDYRHPLLSPLARAQDAVARLEARAEAASPAVAEGLRARMSYREAAGWLGYKHVWIHPQDLALRDAGLTGSYGAAERAGRLAGELPATTARAHEADLEAAPSDIAADLALRFARNWRRLAEFRTWKPIADPSALRETLQSLGFRGVFNEMQVNDWLAATHGRTDGPALIRAGQAAREWMSWSTSADPLSLDGLFLGACLWRDRGFGRPAALPFWSAGEQRLYRLAPRIGVDWMAAFLECAAAAAHAATGELDQLLRAEDKGRKLAFTARSKLPKALQAVLRAPIVTGRGLATSLDVSPQAALGLIGQLREAGIVREATGRGSWRAFVLA